MVVPVAAVVAALAAVLGPEDMVVVDLVDAEDALVIAVGVTAVVDA